MTRRTYDEETMRPHKARYRWRTTLRSNLPPPLWRLVPKGRKDCGEHEWYKSTEDWDACYHCEAGGRPHALIEGGVSQGTEELMREAGLGHLLDGDRDRPRAPT